MSTPGSELVIPVRMDLDKTLGALKKVGVEAKQTGQDVKQGFEQATKGVDETHDAVANLIKAQIGLGIMKQGAQAIAEEYKRTGDTVKAMAQEFASLRQTMQQMAGLKGEVNSNEFTAAEAQKGASASQMPGEWRKFQESFQSYGGAFIEGERSKFKDIAGGPKAGEQAEEYQKQIAEFAKARGMDPGEAARLGGGLLQFSEGTQTTEGLMSRFGKVFKTLDKSPTPVAELLPSMSRVMAQGMSPEEASRALGIMSESSPGEEETHVRAALHGIDDAVLSGKGKRLGITKDMKAFERMEAASRALAKEFEGKNELEQKEALKQLGFVDRETVGMVGLINRGVKARGFEGTKEYQTDKETPTDFTQQEIAKYRKSDAGQHARADADEAVARAKRGAIHAGAELELKKAQTRRTERGETEELHVTENKARDWLTPAAWLGGVDAERQKTNAEALRDVRERALKAGLPAWKYGDSRMAGEGGVRSPGVANEDVLVTSQVGVNKEITVLLKQIAEYGKRSAKSAEEKGAAPLLAKPPNPNLRGTTP